MATIAIVSLGVLAGCREHAASSAEAIQHAKTLKTSAQQADYLMNQAQLFVDSQDYQEAITIAEYVLVSVDARSQAAADLLRQTKAKLAANAQAVIGETKNPVGL